MISEFLRGAADEVVLQPADGGDRGRLTRGELRDGAAAAAAFLSRRGFARGDVLAVWMPGGAAWMQLLFAAARIGVLIVPISPRYKAAEALHLLQVSRARGVVAPARFLDVDYARIARRLMPRLARLRTVFEVADPDRLLPWCCEDTRSGAADVHDNAHDGADDDASVGAHGDALLCCFSTSGTTGNPKLAAHTQAGLAEHARSAASALELRPGDATLCMLPFFGVFGFMTMLATLAAGARCVLLPHFEAADASRAIDAHRITHVVGSDSMFDPMFAAKDADRSLHWRSWRRAVQADFVGLPLSVTQRGDAMDIRFSGVYGSSECLALMSLHDWSASAEQRARAGGIPVGARIGLRVVAPDSVQALPDGEPGEIQIRGPNLTAGYLNNPQASAAAMTADGWFRTGDLGFRDGAGFVYLARLGDSLRLRGYLVSPAEIENCLMQHPAVQGAQVVGARRDGEGEVAVAFVIAGASAGTNAGTNADARVAHPDEAALRAFCRERLASYKVPARFVLVDAFPAINGPNGNKIQKRQLRDMARALLEQEEGRT